MADQAQRSRSGAAEVPQGPDVRSPPRNWRALFIEHLADTSSVAGAAQHAGICPSKAYLARRTEPAFAKQWLAALTEGYVHLEMEVLRRLREGDFTTTGGERYDMANAIRLLAGQRDSGAGTQGAGRDVSAAEVRASIDRKIEDIRRRMSQSRPDESHKS